MLKRRAQPVSQLDAEIRPSMAHKVHQNFAKNICPPSLSHTLFLSIFLSVCACACTLNLIWPAATQEF